MVWETQKPKEPGKSFMSRAISVPLPTPDGPAITRGRTDMGSSAAQQGGAARALLLLLLQGADERTGLGEEEVVCGEGGSWRGEGTLVVARRGRASSRRRQQRSLEDPSWAS